MASLAKLTALALAPKSWPALAKKIAPTIEHRAALGAFNFKTVIDVGANKGQFGYFAQMQWPHAEIHCFEPLPGPGSRLANLLKDNVTLHTCALGSQEGTADMHVASREDSSSLLALGTAQKSMFEMDEVGTHTVTVKRLDHVITPPPQRPTLLKIDVQGFEYEVLEGATALLPHVDVVFVEASYIELYEGQKLADSVITLLETQGFALSAAHNEQCDANGTLVQADLLFIPTPSHHTQAP